MSSDKIVQLVEQGLNDIKKVKEKLAALDEQASQLSIDARGESIANYNATKY